jgi:hypothetical protein
MELMRTWAASVFLAGLSLSLSGLLPGLEWSQSNAAPPTATPIGKILEVKGSVTVEHASAVPMQASLPAGTPGQAKVDDPVYQGDVIQTGANGSASMVFADSTSFNISSNARMELNEFVYDPKGKSNSTLFNLSKGAFTFIAGAVAHTGSMKVETPVATMGIRGTAPHVEILEDGTVKFSTLIEENKKKRPPLEPGRRSARDGTLPDQSIIENAGKDLNHTIKICQNC